MGQVTVELDDDVIERLKKIAEGNERTFEGEIRFILKGASHQLDSKRALALAKEWQEKFKAAGVEFPDTTELLAEDRRR
jgi:predicted transcriptional regulator